MNLKVAVVSNSIYFESYKTALVREIKSKGFEAKGFDHLSYGYEPDVFLIIGVHSYGKFNRYSDFIYCGVQTEQLPTKNTGGRIFGADKIKLFHKLYKNYDFIFEWSISIFEHYKNRYTNMIYFPYAYFDELDVTSKVSDSKSMEKYDLLFIGDISGVDSRREKYLAS